MKIWKKFLAALVLVCLFVNVMPAVSASEVNEEARRGLDYSELELQVAIANGLNSYDYTMESWESLQEVLDVGNKMLIGIYDQGKLDRAADDIADALARLIKMDYSPLDVALTAAEEKIGENPELYDAWNQLNEAVEAAKPLLFSGDQQAVNAAAKEINGLLEEITNCSAAEIEPGVVIQEVEVEVLPTSDFCNIPTHHTWPVLFVISAVLNVALIGALVYVIKRKRHTADNTPLVNYDIDDDMDF